MALFNRRKDNNAAIEQAVTAALEKAGLAGSPLQGANATPVQAPQFSQSIADQVHILGNTVPLPRPTRDFDTIFGPARPLQPAAIDEVNPITGRAMPRRWEYDVAHNLNLSQTTVPWGILTSLYETCDVVWRACEIRIDEITKMDWSFGLTDACISEIMADQNCSHAKAAQIGRDKYSQELARLTEFWDNPYPEMYRGFTEWLTEGLWSFFPFDAMVIYPRYNLKGEPMGLEWIDPRTIKPLLNSRGFTPLPPEPAYQQILFGFPRGEFTASEDNDGEFYNGDLGGAFKTDQLIYSVKNRRTISPYGFSMVEAMVPAATVYLERQRWMREQFQSGASSATWMITDDQFNPQQAREWNAYLNDYLAGNTALRQQIQALPAGFKPEYAPEQAEKYKADLDEFFIKRVASIGGIDPRALGVVPRSGLGGKSEGAEASDQAELVSQKPTEKHVTELINRISRQILGSSRNTTFVLHDNKTGLDDLNKAKAFEVSLYSGQKTLNMIQDELGQPLYEMPEADEPFIVAGNAITFLRGILDVDATGETIGQKGENGEASPQTQGQEGSSPQAPSPNGQESGGSPNGKTREAALERKKFATYLSKRAGTGKWRDFEFTVIDADTAKSLNESGRLVAVGATPSDSPKPLVTKRSLSDHPHHSEMEKVIAHYSPKVHKALKKVTGVDKAVEYALSAVLPKADKNDAHNKQVAHGAVQKYVEVNSAGLAEVIKDMYGDAGLVGARTVGGATLTSDLASLAAEIDWSTWTPGHPDAALKVANGRLRDVLTGQHIDLQGIDNTTLDRIGNKIAEGLSNGDPARVIAKAINDEMGDPARSLIIATTESNRAYCASSIDNIQEAGFSGWDWMTYDGACEECLAQEEQNPHQYGDDYPPEHPSCRCWPAPTADELPS